MFSEELPVCLPLRIEGGGRQRISREIRNDKIAAAPQTKNALDVACTTSPPRIRDSDT